MGLCNRVTVVSGPNVCNMCTAPAANIDQRQGFKLLHMHQQPCIDNDLRENLKTVREIYKRLGAEKEIILF
eukprot:1150049-Pelagomonas_calceolata.AAC.3